MDFLQFFCYLAQFLRSYSAIVKPFRNKADIDLPRVYRYKEIRRALCSVKAVRQFPRSLYCTRISCNKRANYRSDDTNPAVFPCARFGELHSLSWPCHCYHCDRYYYCVFVDDQLCAPSHSINQSTIITVQRCNYFALSSLL